jgi:catechol 2,3-dioxygenase-like lactoylglutathione lyase family enzyme
MNRSVIVAGIALAASLSHAQPQPSPPPGSAPAGLVVGSGNFFSPIVANLDEAIAFYRDGIGLDIQGEPRTADASALRQMYGVPDARLRWQTARAPRVQGGVDLVEISPPGREPLQRQMQDPGAFMLMVVVRDIDATLARLKQLDAPVVTRGGVPVTVGGPQGVRAVVVRDPAGHFIELVQPPRLPPTLVPENVVGVRLRHTVANLERAVALYRDALGLRGGNGSVPPDYYNEPSVLELLGVPEDTLWRFTGVAVPTTGLQIELMEFKGSRAPEPADIADTGATRIQLRVTDLDAAVAELTKAGGTVISTGGRPFDVAAGDVPLKVATVRDPDNWFLVLIESPPTP